MWWILRVRLWLGRTQRGRLRSGAVAARSAVALESVPSIVFNSTRACKNCRAAARKVSVIRLLLRGQHSDGSTNWPLACLKQGRTLPLQIPEDPTRRDQHHMQRAYEQAVSAGRQGEVPVGAVIVHQGQIVAAAHNQRETLRDPTAHAEMIAITQAAESLGSWRLTDCTLYVTLEPCPMCAGAIVQARLPRLVYGAADPKAGAVDSLFQLLSDTRLNHQTDVIAGVLAEPCGEILSEFFRQRRKP